MVSPYRKCDQEFAVALRAVGVASWAALYAEKSDAAKAVRERFHDEWSRRMYARTRIDPMAINARSKAARIALAKERDARIVEMAREGVAPPDIANDIGLSPERVRFILRERGFVGDRHRAALTATTARWARATPEDRARQGEMLRRTKGMRGVAA